MPVPIFQSIQNWMATSFKAPHLFADKGFPEHFNQKYLK